MSQERKSDISEEAAMWLARMLRSDAGLFEPDFRAWLEADDAHRLAYERLRQQYQRSGVLEHSRLFAAPGGSGERRRWFLPIGLGVGAILAGLAAAAVMLLSLSAVFTTLLKPTNGSTSSETAGVGARGPDAFVLTSPRGDIRTMSLPDGSRVTLDTGAVVTVAYSATQRLLTLSAGRARFDVSHERRPFIVAAGTGDITAHGTVFDVEIMSRGAVQVVLLRGAIGVRVRDPRTNQQTRRELIAHQKTDFDKTGFVTPIRRLPILALEWPSGVVDVDGMALSDLLAQINRYTDAPIKVGDPSLASLQVSGRFQVNHPDLVVQNLVDLFGLTVDRRQKDRIILRRKISASAGPA